MKRIGVLTSGGDAPGMNAAIRAVVRCGKEMEMEIYGIQRGFEGLIEGEISELDRSDVADILHRGGTMLKTARSSRFMDPEGREHALMILDTFGIEGLCIIGGDGSMHGAWELSKAGLPVVCIPGTIDNDMAYTDRTIGFDTAVNTVLEAISKIRDTSSSHDRTAVIEVMGRHCGDIALYSGLAGGAEAILIPEMKADINAICRKILAGANRGKRHSIIINAEGSGVDSRDLVSEIEKRTGSPSRLAVLSYLQRGGVPTLADRLLASCAGAKAIDLMQRDEYPKAIGILDGKMIAVDLEEAIHQERPFNMEMYKLIDVLSK